MFMPDFEDMKKLKQQMLDMAKAQDEVEILSQGYDLARNEDDIILKLFDNEKGFKFSFNKNTNEVVELMIDNDNPLKKSNMTLIEFMSICHTIAKVVEPHITKELKLKYPSIANIFK